MKQYRVCVIGCGVIAPNHMEALSSLDNTQLVGVCDVIADRAKAAGEKYGCPAYTDYKQMVRELHPDAVHLCLPHYLHSPVAVDCMEMGCDVLSEKPMNANYKGALAMLEASKRTGCRLGVIFQNRYNTGSVLAKKAIAEGKLGKLLSINGMVMWHRDDAYYASGEWRKSYETSGGGVLINQAIHTLDLCRWLADSPVVDVKATVSHHGDTSAEVEDATEGVITFENGVKGLFYFTINNTFDDAIVVRAHGTEGDLTVTGGRCKIVYKDGSVEEDKPDELQFCGAKAVYGTGHIIQIAHFYEEDGDEAVRQTALEALATQKLIADIFASAGIKTVDTVSDK